MAKTPAWARKEGKNPKEVEVLKSDEMSDQEMADLCEEEVNKQVTWILTRKLFE